MAAAKTIEIIGRSSTGSDDAVRQALEEARRTVRNITGIDVVSTGLRGDPLEWRALVRIAFVIESRPEGSARRSASAEAAALRLEEREG